MYLLSKKFRETCYKNSYKNSKIIITDNEISFVNKDMNFNDFDLSINNQKVKKCEVYYNDNNGNKLSIALKDHETKCIIIGKIDNPNIDEIKFNKEDYILQTGIL